MPASIKKNFAFGDLSRDAEEAVDESLRRFGLILEKRIKEEMDELGITVSGQKGLRGSVTHVVDQRGGNIRLTVGPTASYAIYVLEGTRPHVPPKGPIRSWVRKKLGISAASTINQEVVFWDDEAGEVVRFKARVNELEQVTQAVRYKIAKRGTEGQDFLTDPLTGTIDDIVEGITKDLQTALDNE